MRGYGGARWVGRGGCVGGWELFMCSKYALRAIRIHIYIYIYMYIYLTYKASRLVDQHLDADRRIRNEELEWNINI
jgi:hypothetical protein